MQQYIGTKRVTAAAMTLGAYNTLRGWPSQENPDDPGYLVEYTDGGGKNHDDFANYITWSPADVFDRAYKPTTALDFGRALAVMKEGGKVARAGWNGKGMFVFRVPGSVFSVNRPPLLGIYPEGTPVTYRTHYDMRTADGQIVPWICSQSDMDEEDWCIVE